MADPSLLAFSFSLGAAAFFSPCGFPMLPAYLAWYLPRAGEEGGAPRGSALARGLAGGALAGLGAFLVLLLVGGAAAALGAPFKERVVLLELLGGLVVLALGVATLLGRGPALAFALRPARRRDALGLVAFGALYAAVAAGCVAPLLLAVLVLAFGAGSLLDGLLYVGAYAAGLSLLLVALTVLVATAQGALVARLRALLPRVEKAGGVLLVLVGLYLLWFWAGAEGYVRAPPTWTPPLP